MLTGQAAPFWTEGERRLVGGILAAYGKVKVLQVFRMCDSMQSYLNALLVGTIKEVTELK